MHRLTFHFKGKSAGKIQSATKTYFTCFVAKKQYVNQPREAFFLFCGWKVVVLNIFLLFLQQLLTNKENGKRLVVFINELPWMDTPGSGFITALESFWNGWGYSHNNLCLIVCGIAFEEVCMNHIGQIKRALGIEGVSTQISAYSVPNDDESDGFQIDMLIDRADRIINVCEMKFVNGDFTVDKSYHRKLTNRLLTFRQNEKKSIHSTLVTTYGLTPNEYSSIFQNCISLDELFLP